MVVGIKDVAQAAGVSPSTASQALRGEGRISDATRERVRRVAGDLGYRANAAARSLRGGRTAVLALTIPQMAWAPGMATTIEYFARVIRSAVGAALARDHALVVAPFAADGRAWERLAFDGAIVVDPLADDAVVALLVERGSPIVTIGRVPGSDRAHLHVDNDFDVSIRALLDHLGGRVALLAAPPHESYYFDALEAYRGWCSERGAPAEVRLADGLDDDAALAAARALLAEDPPDAVFATLEPLAAAVLRAAAERGLDVPGDLRLATCSDGTIARSAGITTLDERPEDLGRVAVELLTDMLNGHSAKPRVIGADLIVRHSSSPPERFSRPG